MTKEEAIKMVQAHKFPKPTEEWQMLNNEALDMAIESLSEGTKGYSTMSEEYDEAIESLQTEVVRCKNCKHYSVKGETTLFGWCGSWNRPTSEMRFCSKGKRIEKSEVEE